MPLARHLAVVLAAGLAFLALPGAASAAVIPVTITEDITSDDGDCGLFEAVLAAQNNADGSGGCVATDAGGEYGNDTIDLDGLEYQITDGEIQLQAGAPAGTLTFEGVPGSTVMRRSGAGSRIFSISQNAVVEIKGVALENGQVPVAGEGSDGGGGGCILSEGSLTLRDSAVRNCQAGAGGAGATGSPGDPGGDGGNGGVGGGIFAQGDLTLDNTEVTGNHAGAGGAGGDGVSGGDGGDGGDGGNGGGLATALGAAQLDGVALAGNHAGDGGDGDFSQDSQNGDGGMGGAGGGWYSENLAPELLTSTVTGNVAGARGAFASSASENGGGPGGGIRAVNVNAQLTVERSTIADNEAGLTPFGDAGSGGGLSLLESAMNMQDSAVTGNQAGDGAPAAGDAGDGGGIHVDGTTNGLDVIIGNSTIAENSAGSAASEEFSDGRGGGIMQAGPGPDVDVSTSTVAGNSVPAGSTGGGLDSASTIHLVSTIIAGNQAGTESSNCFGSFFDVGFNLTSEDSCPGTVGDAKLGPLAGNGGPTETMGLNVGSAALNKIPPPCVPTDQRGFPRPVGGACDIGAFEGVLPTAGPGPSGPGGPVVPGGPGGPAGTAAFGRSALIRLSLGAKTIKSKGPVAVVIANGNAFTVTGRLSATTTKPVASAGAAAKKRKRAKRISLKAKAFTVAGSGRKTVRLKLPAKLRRLLKRAGKLSLRVKVVVTDPSGNRRTVSRVVKLKLKKPKRKK